MNSPLGAVWEPPGRCRFRVWAPHAGKVEVRIVAPKEKTVAMEPEDRGYHQAVIEDVQPGSLYLYRLHGNTEKRERPDPASRSQPQGVHGSSEIIDPRFRWDEGRWHGVSLEDYVLYEIHAGTFTPEGTFDAAIQHLDEIKDLGITAIEIMPVAQCPGERNWGYDTAYPFAVQHSLGGSAGLKRLVNACHQRGLAVVLDVVYNHVGPEGNYLGDFAPYFTDRYNAAWGPALNFDGPHSDEVRRYFIENALYWLREFHVDAFRLDAIHAIVELGARPFLIQLGEEVHRQAEELNRKVFLIAESDLNDSRTVRSLEEGGYGLDAQWMDDFHHSLHALLTGERVGYYADFGKVEHLAKALREGFVYSGQYSSYRKRSHGTSSLHISPHRMVVCAQNHDQIGNRMRGERLNQLVSPEEFKLASAAVILSPYIPLLFMGQEYGEPAPFHYFVSHSDPKLIEAVRKGRKEEYSGSQWKGEPPDPPDERTFLRSKLQWKLRNEGQHRLRWRFTQELLRLRRELPALRHLSRNQMAVRCDENIGLLQVHRRHHGNEALALFHFGKNRSTISLQGIKGQWRKRLDSTDPRWGGSGSEIPGVLDFSKEAILQLQPSSLVLFTHNEETHP